jgi:pimeloyl-ACP methyl ester carboxylesterase/DNA-binding CsgD family transcriptional regulator
MIATTPTTATEPRIQYARSGDGASIAYWTLGEGVPLVYLAGGPWSHVELWQLPACRTWYERLAQKRMLVRHDVRGTGLSARTVADYSLDALVADVEAVVDRLGLDRFALLGAADAGPVAIAFASCHPGRVSRLVLWCAWARMADVTSPRLRAWRGLLDQDWDLMTETCAHLALGWSAGEIGRQAAARLREVVTPEAVREALNGLGTHDATALLPQVQAPTLVVHRRDIPWFPVAIAQELASRLRDARLAILAGESTAPYLGDVEAVCRAIDEFLVEGEQGPRQAAPRARDALVLGPHPPRVAATGGSPDRLTARETQVLRLIAGGFTNAEIADALNLSVRTVERHIGNLYGKIGARGRADATAYALTRGLV